MLSTTLKNIENYLLEQSQLNNEQLEQLIGKLKYYNNGSYIDPYDIKDFLDLNDKENQKLFGKLIGYGAVKPAYKYYCPKCGKYSDYPVDTLEELDETENCEECFYEFSSDKFKYIVLFFKVVVE